MVWDESIGRLLVVFNTSGAKLSAKMIVYSWETFGTPHSNLSYGYLDDIKPGLTEALLRVWSGWLDWRG